MGSAPAWDAVFSYGYVLLWIFLSATVILFNKCDAPVPHSESAVLQAGGVDAVPPVCIQLPSCCRWCLKRCMSQKHAD